MTPEVLLIWIIIGAVAGFLAGLIVKGYGFGVIGNIVIGIIGAFIGGYILPRVGLFTSTDILGQIISATLGAILLLIAIGVARRIA